MILGDVGVSLPRMQVAEKHHTDWKPASRRWSSAVWPGCLLIIITCFFWKLVFTAQYTWLDSPDAANQILPWYQFEAGELHQGRMPLWDPYLWGGQPLLAQAQPGAAYPPNWLLFLAPLRRGWIRQPFLHWYFVLIHFQAALFCYWLCRDLKRSHAASLLSGLAFALGGYFGTNTWPMMLNGAVWAPLILMFFLRAMRGIRPVTNIAWSGAFLGISFLSGHHQMPIFMGLMMGGLWIYYAFSNRNQPAKNLKLLFIFSTFVILLGALQTLPTYQYGKLAVRWVGAENPVGWKDTVPYYVHQRYELNPESLLGIILPGVYRNSDPYVGLAALTLALFGLVSCWGDRMARLFAAIAIGGLLFSLGHNSVFHGVLYSLIPFVEKARNASMASFIFHIGLCVLIAYGVHSYDSVSIVVRRRASRLLLGVAAMLGIIIWIFQSTKVALDDRMGIVMIAALLMAAILTAVDKMAISAGAAIVLTGGVMLLELGNVTTYSYPAHGVGQSFVKPLSEHADIAAFLRNQVDPVRVEINEQEIPYNFGDWYGIEHFGGYLASLTENVSRVQGNPRARLMYGVNFHVGKTPGNPSQTEVFAGPQGIKVYAIPGAFPRVWAVHEVSTIERDDQIGAKLDDPAFDPHRQVFVKGRPPNLAVCS